MVVTNWIGRVYFVALRRGDGLSPSMEKGIHGRIFFSVEDGQDFCDGINETFGYGVELFFADFTVPMEQKIGE